MSRYPELHRKKPGISETFDTHPTRIFTETDLRTFIAEHRNTWHVPYRIGFNQLLDFLSSEGKLKREVLKSRDYGNRIRFCWGKISDYELGLSIAKGSYISHSSAAFLHGLMKEDSSIITVNKEQSPKSTPDLDLSQSSIDRAFGNRPRTSNYVFKFRKRQVRVVSGKNTGKLGVCTLRLDGKVPILLTGLERTLIDISVRPEYAGGPKNVLAAFRIARNRVSPKILTEMLEQLDHVYPFHQAIGFYMARAGYPESSIQSFRKKAFRFDFYLMHGISQPDYDPEWKLHVPKGFMKIPVRPQTCNL